ncbi:MAG: transcriptional repressor [Spirochaetales bacterium]|nr:transcriptional repressor [Spirochaetales bacterium]MCF7937164.1 transcriptional repressor [Spirochaetales bacterium]
MTVPRQAVLEVLSADDRYRSAEEIFFQLHEQYPAVGLTSVYRTLTLLAQMGLVERFDMGDGKARFRLRTGAEEGSSCRLICTNCMKVEPCDQEAVEDQAASGSMDDVTRSLETEYGFQLRRRVVEYYGLCVDCRRRNEEKRSQEEN